MRKFTESQKSPISISGWALWNDQTMRNVEFSIDGPRFSANYNKYRWVLSDNPYDYSNFIGDKVYTKVNVLDDKIEYTDPIILSDWIKSNLDGFFSISDQLHDVTDYFIDFFDLDDSNRWDIEVHTMGGQYEASIDGLSRIESDHRLDYSPKLDEVYIIISKKSIRKFDTISGFMSHEKDKIIEESAERIANSKNLELKHIHKYKRMREYDDSYTIGYLLRYKIY